MTGTAVCAEMVAPVANMLAAVLVADGVAAGEAVRQPTAEVSGEGREQAGCAAPGPGGDRLRATVDVGSGARAHRVDGPPVRAGRGGHPVGLAGWCDRGDRRRPGHLWSVHRRAGWVQGAGGPG